MNQKRKIYLASSWRNDLQQAAVQLLRQHGHEVYDFKNPAKGETGFSWAEIDPEWRNWTPEQFIKNLSHPFSERGFKLDYDGMMWADTCVLLLPCGRSAHAEAGWMKAAGKKVYVVTTDGQEPELMYKLFDFIFDELPDLILYLKQEWVEEKQKPSFEEQFKLIDERLYGLNTLFEFALSDADLTQDRREYETWLAIKENLFACRLMEAANAKESNSVVGI